MGNKRDFSSYMDGQEDIALQPFDEAWFDVSNPCGKEFELPNISTPINPQWSDNGNLVFLEDQQPDILENIYEAEMTSSPCFGNEVDSFPLVKMVPSLTSSVPTVDPREVSSFANHVVYFPEVKQLVFMPTPAGINSSSINQDFNSPSISLTNSSLLINNSSHFSRFVNNFGFVSNVYSPTIFTSPNVYQRDSDVSFISCPVCYSSSIIDCPVCFSSFGVSYSFGSDGFPPVYNQEISFSINDSAYFLQNGLSGQWNQAASVPVMANVYQGSANGDISHGPNPRQSVGYSTGSTSNV